MVLTPTKYTYCWKYSIINSSSYGIYPLKPSLSSSLGISGFVIKNSFSKNFPFRIVPWLMQRMCWLTRYHLHFLWGACYHFPSQPPELGVSSTVALAHALWTGMVKCHFHMEAGRAHMWFPIGLVANRVCNRTVKGRADLLGQFMRWAHTQTFIAAGLKVFAVDSAVPRGGSSDGSSAWVPAACMEDLECMPSSCLQLQLGLLREPREQTSSFSLSLLLSLQQMGLLSACLPACMPASILHSIRSKLSLSISLSLIFSLSLSPQPKVYDNVVLGIYVLHWGVRRRVVH